MLILSLFLAACSDDSSAPRSAEPDETLYDNFSSGGLDEDKWTTRVTGPDSAVVVDEGELVATTSNDPNGESGRAGLNFVDPDFEAFSAETRIVEGDSEGKARSRLEGQAYSTQPRSSDSEQGEVTMTLALRTDGRVQYALAHCEDADCDETTEIASGTLAEVDPGEMHVLAMGFDGATVWFSLDGADPVTIQPGPDFPVNEAGWRRAGLRGRSKEGTERVTAAFDDVRVGTVEALLTRN